MSNPIGSVERPIRSAEHMHVAEDFVKDQFETPGGGCGLWWREGQFIAWIGGRWKVVSQDEMDRQVWRWLKDAHYRTGDGVERVQPDLKRVANVMRALEAGQTCPWRDLPLWTKAPEGGPWDPLTCIAFRDVVVSVGEGTLRTAPRDESWLDTAMVECEWSPGAKCPRWEKALEEWGEGDREWGESLRRLFGYALMGKRSYAKWFLLQGKSRGGKGVICRTLKRLVGDQAWFSANLGDLADRNGLDGAQGRRVMNVPEVSLEDFNDRQKAARVLKSVVGEDDVQIKAKYQRPLHNVRLLCVPIMSGNMIPLLPNEAQGLSAKMIVIPFTRTFLGHEQFDLEEELAAELPGIAAWAVEGARLLEESKGRGWVECKASADVRLRFRIENNPFDAFLEARCTPNPTAFVPTGMLYDEFEDFLSVNGIRGVHVPRNRFGVELESGCTWDVRRGRRRLRTDPNPSHVIFGLSLRRNADDHI